MNRCLVIDTSFIMSDLLPDENGMEINLALYALHVPALFFLECANVLNVALKRARIKKEEHQEYLQIFQHLPITVDKFCATAESLHLMSKLAQEFELTLYDAAYLELAIRLDATLATFDQQLKAVALKNKIKII